MGPKLTIQELARLSMSVDDAQEFFMKMAENHKEITLTFKNEEPFVTVFLNKGKDVLIGFGNSVAVAVQDALAQRKRR